jgi:arabinose-5-phosphate isomerase
MDEIETAKKVLAIESEAIHNLIDRLDNSFVDAVDLIHKCCGRVVVSGMGKSGIICRKIAATLSSTGTPALFLHPADAVHGDLGMIASGDVVLAVSNSGQTEEILKLLEFVKRIGIPIISLVGNKDSALAKNSDICIGVEVEKEACPMGLVPTASTAAQLAIGDALSVAVAQKRGFRAEDFAELHPGGKLGKKLMRVKDLMHTGSDMPRVETGMTMKDAILEMSGKGLGMTTVVDSTGRLAGIITDGDLRRLLQKKEDPLGKKAEECMTPHPKTISADELASKALALMEAGKITSIIVTDEHSKVEGVVHIHDLWSLELF